MSAKSEALRTALRGLLTGDAAPAGRRIVYHGSPHVFDRFSMSRLGTGEGSQVYGHGLYFAEHPEVAMSYRDKLADPLLDASYGTSGRMYERGMPEWKMLATVYNGGMREARRLLKMYQDDLAKSEPYILEMGGDDFVRRAEGILNDVRGRKDVQLSSGRLYEADIPEGPYLDWDAPIEQQPPGAIDAMHPDFRRMREMIAAGQKPATAARDMAFNPMYGYLDQGSVLYQSLADRLGEKRASATLNNAGIPGIRFLDEGSREAGQGTSNFVMFNDKDINMRALRSALLALGAGGAGALASNSNPTA